MHVAVSRAKPPDERRADLLRAASQLFVSKGVSEVKVEDITAAAGVAKGTFYLYFESKAHALHEVRLQVSDRLLHRLAELATSERIGGWWDLADETVRVTIEYWMADRDLHRIALAGPGDALDSFSDHERSMEATLADFIRAGVAEGVASCPDPELTARLIVHAVEGVVYHAITAEAGPDTERLVATTTEFLHRVLRA